MKRVIVILAFALAISSCLKDKDEFIPLDTPSMDSIAHGAADQVKKDLEKVNDDLTAIKED